SSARELVRQQLATTYPYPAAETTPHLGRYGARTAAALHRAHAAWSARTTGWEARRRAQLADLSYFLDHVADTDETLSAAFERGQHR
ncbi:hypothetical protein, partial [Corynebacterium sp. LK2514]